MSQVLVTVASNNSTISICNFSKIKTKANYGHAQLECTHPFSGQSYLHQTYNSDDACVWLQANQRVLHTIYPTELQVKCRKLQFGMMSR